MISLVQLIIMSGLLIVACGNVVLNPRPVMFMHGILDNPHEPDFASQYIPKMAPGTIVYVIKMYNFLCSLENLDHQLKSILPDMQEIMDKHKDTGVNLLCFSQGGVICRAAVQMLHHNIHSFIVLSSPIAGQYGVTDVIEKFLPSKDRTFLWRFLYTSEGQDISFGNYWNDPHHQLEFTDPKLNILLARLNNQNGHGNCTEYKENFLRLSNLVLVGGPNDTVITPWQSAHFGFYDDKENIINMEQQEWYLNDSFGLRSLDRLGKVHIITMPNIEHIHWYRTAAVYDRCVLPYL